MRALLPEVLAEVDVLAHYADGWIDPGGVRANMIASVDGAAAADGLSAGLQTAGDNQVFGVLRELADVVLVGAATAVAEQYQPVNFSATRIARRRTRGFGDRLPIAVISRSLRIDLSAPVFADPDQRPLVVTTKAADPALLTKVEQQADVLVCGEMDVDWSLVRSELAERGLRRVLCEGGPTILSQLLLAGAIDELCLSISPMVAGPKAGRIVAGDPWPNDPKTLSLHGLLEEDGALFLRYRRA